MNGPIPDRVSIEADSPFHDPRCVQIGVRFKGVERPGDVVEFCVSEGWIRTFITINGKRKTERGRYVAAKFSGKVEPFWRSAPSV